MAIGPRAYKSGLKTWDYPRLLGDPFLFEPKPKPEFGEFGAGEFGEFGAGAGGVLALVAAEVEARGRKGARLGGQSGEGARR